MDNFNNNFNNLSDIGNPANSMSPFNIINDDSNRRHQFDAINIANGHPEYAGSGILAPIQTTQNTIIITIIMIKNIATKKINEVIK